MVFTYTGEKGRISPCTYKNKKICACFQWCPGYIDGDCRIYGFVDAPEIRGNYKDLFINEKVRVIRIRRRT